MVDPLFSIGGIASGLDTNSIITQLMTLEEQPIRRFESAQQELRAVDTAWSAIVSRMSSFRSALDAVATPGALSALNTASSSDPDAVRVTGASGGEEGSLSFTVEALAQRHRDAFSGTFSSSGDLVSAGSVTLTDSSSGQVLGTVTTDGTESLSVLASRIDDLDVGIDAQVIKVSDSDYQLVLSSTETGADTAFTATTDIAELGSTVSLSTGGDARLTIGSLTVTRSSNTIDDLLPGAIIDLRETTTSEVTVAVEQDVEAVVTSISDVVSSANALLEKLKTDTAYDAETGRAGVLQGNSLARELGFGLRAALTSFTGDGSIGYANELGISLTRDGLVELDEEVLREALATDPEGVEQYLSAAVTGDPGIMVDYVGTDAADGSFTATVSQAASTASATSGAWSVPATGYSFTIETPAGNVVDVAIDAGMDVDAAVERIRASLDVVDDQSMVVDAVGGEIRLSSVGYGSARSFTVTDSGTALDLGPHTGTDVVVDFGEGAVTGNGRSVSGDGAATGLSLTITGGVGSYDLGFSTGLSGVLDRYMDGFEGADGRIQTARDAISGRISDYDDQIASFEQRLEIREARLRQQFTGLETAMARLQSQGQWLAGALSGLVTPSTG